MKIWRMLFCGFLLASASLLWAQNPFDLPRRPIGPYEIRGTVVDGKTGQPLPEVELSFQESAQPASPPFEIIQSDTNGSFHLGNLAEGKYTIRATRQGYASQAFLQHENFWTGVAVGPAKDSLHVRFPLSASATITGQVINENGEAVRGASVTLWTEELENGLRSVTQGGTVLTDDEGSYRLEHLFAGKYSVNVQAVPWYSRYAGPRIEDGNTYLPDVVYPTLYYPNARDWRGMEWISLHAGETANADFHLAPEPSAHVQVQVSEDPNVQSRIALAAELPGGATNRVAYSVADIGSGMMEISGIAAGRYQLQEEGITGIKQDLEVSGTSQIQLNAPAASGIVVRGSIQVVDGDPKLENGFVQLKDANGHAYVAQYHGDSTDEKHPAGSFEFENVPSGPQVFEVSVLQPLDVLIRKIDAKGAKVTDATVVTDSGQELNLLVTAARISSAITGIVTKQGKPYAGAMILLMPENGKDWKRFVRRDQSDSDGTFRVATIVPGKYSLLALEHGWDIEWSKPEVLQPFLKKAQKLEIGERQFDPVILEVQ